MNDSDFWDHLRPLVGRLVGIVVTWALVHTAAWLHVPLPADLPNVATEMCALLLVYVVAHRMTDRRVNPGDAASATIARVELAEKAQIRAAVDATPGAA